MGLLQFCQIFDRLLIEEEGQLLCYKEPSNNLKDGKLRISSPLSLFLACFRLGHYNKRGGHRGALKTCNKGNRFHFGPGMFDWICAITDECVTCQNNKPILNTEMKYHWKNGKTRLLHSEQSVLITDDLFTHQLTKTFIVSWLLMHSLAPWCYIELRPLELKLLFLLLRKG